MTDSSTTTLLVAALSSGGLATIIASIISARSSKKKLGADATEAIQRAASGVVADLERQVKYRDEELERVRREHREAIVAMAAEHTVALQKVVDEYERDRESWRDQLATHIAWDWIVIEKVAPLGIELPDPPPILPRQR